MRKLLETEYKVFSKNEIFIFTSEFLENKSIRLKLNYLLYNVIGEAPVKLKVFETAHNYIMKLKLPYENRNNFHWEDNTFKVKKRKFGKFLLYEIRIKKG